MFMFDIRGKSYTILSIYFFLTKAHLFFRLLFRIEDHETHRLRSTLCYKCVEAFFFFFFFIKEEKINTLKIHLNKDHDINKYSEYHGETGDYNISAIMQQSVFEENYVSTNSHHDIHIDKKIKKIKRNKCYKY